MRRLRWPGLLILLVLVLRWSGSGAPGAADRGLRIVCFAGAQFVRCPSVCELTAVGTARCQCQDFYYRRGDEPLRFSHSLCR